MNAFTHERQRGASLIEVLASALVLSLGVVAVAQLQGHLRLGADAARQRGQALQLAQQHMEQLRAFSALNGSGSYAAIATVEGDPQAPAAYGNSRYVLSRSVSTSGAPAHKSTIVSVAWTDRSGAARTLTLDSLIAGQSPSLVAALALRREQGASRSALGRAPTIPARGKDLGDGRSVWKPAERGALAYVFDHGTGRIVARCDNIATTMTTAQIGPAEVAGCTPDDAWLLSGLVRASSATPPDAQQSAEAPPALAVALTVTGPAAECHSEAQQAVLASTETGPRRVAVPQAATPASQGFATWTELGDRFVAYHCRIPRQAAGWSGRSRVVPEGWTIGARAGDRRVCRYVSDADGNGRIDANVEHPEEYRSVDESLIQQNFLLVRGDQACPSAQSAAVATVAHQP